MAPAAPMARRRRRTATAMGEEEEGDLDLAGLEADLADADGKKPATGSNTAAGS